MVSRKCILGNAVSLEKPNASYLLKWPRLLGFLVFGKTQVPKDFFITDRRRINISLEILEPSVPAMLSRVPPLDEERRTPERSSVGGALGNHRVLRPALRSRIAVGALALPSATPSPAIAAAALGGGGGGGGGVATAAASGASYFHGASQWTPTPLLLQRRERTRLCHQRRKQSQQLMPEL